MLYSFTNILLCFAYISHDFLFRTSQVFLQFEYTMLYTVALWQIIIWFPVGKNVKKVVYPWSWHIQFSLNCIHFLNCIFWFCCAKKMPSKTHKLHKSYWKKFRAFNIAQDLIRVCNSSIWDPDFMPHFCFNHCTFSRRVTHVS